jgi:glutamate--cysteine ligase
MDIPNNFQQRLRALSPAVLKGLKRGIEKESLRVQPDGALALSPHPRALGSALKHPHITTDFSEALIELITGVHTGVEACLEEMKRIHQFVYRHIGEELLWGASMPCKLPDEAAIPIARYGTSNVGRAKTVYRVGLTHRYGKRMQMIAGVHYNFSLPEAAWPALLGKGDPNEAYFALIRNFRRHAWLLLYLFGASPAVCACFVEGRKHPLKELAPGTLHLPYATSLRMGRLGYLSEAQDSLLVSYNDLASYTASLYDALTQPYPPYEAIGLRDGRVPGDGVESYRQLAASLLQIENEFYSTIRPKRVIRPGERPLHALRERGVEYVEVRAMDLDPYSPAGIAPATARFLDVFLLHCLLYDSPPDTKKEIEAIGKNKQLVASRGRESGLTLDRYGETVKLREWGGQILAECAPIARALDEAHGAAHGKGAHREALAAAVEALDDPDSLPSARMLREMRERHGNSYLRFALERSLENRYALQNDPLPPQTEARFVQLAEKSIAKQREIEAADEIPFETYRQRYLSPESLRV